MALSHIDCEPPTDEESSVENGNVFPGCECQRSFVFDRRLSWPTPDWKWKFLFSQQVYSLVIDSLLSAKVPTYETVLDLDRRIRQTTLPAVRLYLRPDEDDYTNPALCMKSYLMSQYRSISTSATGSRSRTCLLTSEHSHDLHSQVRPLTYTTSRIPNSPHT